MLISYNWLQDFTKIKLSPKELAHRLTMSGTEINSIEKVKGDYIYDAEVTPNRPDLLSMIGIAREASAITNQKVKIPKAKKFSKRVENNLDVKIEASSACTRYNATLLRDAEIKVSPAKITRRLNILNVRPVNNIVDITNYILFETGQPLHAFDYDKIEGSKIIVRWAKKNESIVAIDGNSYKLDNDILVIADEQKPIAIAGIMGGIDTEINLDTKNVLLECAHFDQVAIRKTIRKLGLSSDSSYRFERGVCISDIPRNARKASFLIKDYSNSKITGNVDVYKKKIKDKYTHLRKAELKRLLGFDLPAKQIKGILTHLDFEIISSSKDKIEVKIPPFRKDISREADLVEEIARIYGYDKIEPTLTKVSPRKINKYKSTLNVDEAYKQQAKRIIRNVLTSFGLYETISYSLINEEDLNNLKYDKNGTVNVVNPLSSQQGTLRPLLICGLLASLKWNVNRQVDNVNIFELGKVFSEKKGKVAEKEMIGICLSGKKYFNDWQVKSRPINFYDIKGIGEKLFSSINITDYKIEKGSSNYLDEHQSGLFAVKNKEIAVFGKMKRNILNSFDIEEDVYAAEINFEKLLPFIKLDKKVESIPRYPHIVRDLAVIVKEDIESNDITEQINKIGKPLIKEVTLFDVYRGKQIPPGCKSLAYSIKYQSKKRTLKDEEVDAVQEEIQKTLVEKLKAQIR